MTVIDEENNQEFHSYTPDTRQNRQNISEIQISKNVRSDEIIYSPNIVRQVISTNEKIEDKLHVIAVISNPCLFKKRYKLMKEFILRMENDESDVILYIVELAYGDQQFGITDSNNKRHLQLRTPIPLWHKENMINLGVKHLLPPDWKAFAWVDADLEFESPTWASDALKLLNGSYDIIQLFSHCLDLDDKNLTMNVFSSFCYQYCKGFNYSALRGPNYSHPGWAYASTRSFFERMGGMFEYGILGSADFNTAMSLIGLGNKSFIAKSNDVFRQKVLQLQERVKGAKIGYVPGVIRHYFHGSKKNRKYAERWQILAKYDYNPDLHITKDANGVLIPTKDFPKKFVDDIYQYFVERNEDE